MNADVVDDDFVCFALGEMGETVDVCANKMIANILGLTIDT